MAKGETRSFTAEEEEGGGSSSRRSPGESQKEGQEDRGKVSFTIRVAFQINLEILSSVFLIED